jgi:hypothetical protein
VRYFTDTTGRFSRRPHNQPAEIDRLCEQVLREFFGSKIPFPVPTDELTKLIERSPASAMEAMCAATASAWAAQAMDL